MSATALFEEIKQDQLRLQEKIKQHGQEALKQYFVDFFEKNPTINAVRWAQYTPYFNDGDPCTFSINEPEFKIEGLEGNSDDEDDEDDYGGRYSYGDAKGWTSAWNLKYENESDPLIPVLKQVQEDFNANEMVFEMVFGDHVQVTATSDGFEVEEYEHD